jgi:hypothetical protein
VRVFLWPFSPPHGENDKHHEWKNKNACQVVVMSASMIYNYAIHVQVEEGGKDGNVESNDIPKIDDCLSMLHNVW